METTLLDHLRSKFTPATANDLAKTLGEKPTTTQKALDGIIPTIAAGVTHSAATDEGVATLYHLLKSTSFDTDSSVGQLVETDSHRQRAAESGNSLLKKLYDERIHQVAESMAQYSGVGLGAATTMMGLVMSVLMGFLHRQASTRNLSQAQLATMLRGESDSVRATVPSALAGLVGWFIGNGTGRPATMTVRPETTTTVRRDDDRKAAAFPWLRWLLIGLGLLLLFWLLTRACNRYDVTTTITDTTTSAPSVSATDTIASDLDGNELATVDSVDANPTANGPEVRVGVDLPGGRRLNVAENSFNYSLARFLANKGGKTPKVFTFDNLTFETNSARITAKARPNINDLIQIMQAYPNLNIRIEGSTDSTGPDAINDPLSAERAQAVKNALVQAGIDSGRVATRELGDSKPVASNQTKVGREKNRRIDVVVTRL